MANEIKNPFIYGFYDVEDPFMPIAVQMCGNVQAAIDESLGTINITGSSLTYTLTVNGRNAGTINIPSFVDDVQYDADTKELVFSYGENTIRVSVSDLVDTYTAGEGIEVSGNVISCNLVDDVQSLKDKDVEIENSVNTKANASEVYTKAEIDAKGFLTEHQDISGKADITALNSVKDLVDANSSSINTINSSISTIQGDLAAKASTADLNALSNTVDTKIDASALDGYATETWVEAKNYLTEHQSLTAYSTTEQITAAITTAVAPKANAVDVYTKAEVDESQNAQDNVIVTKADANSVLSRIQMLEEKIAALSKTNVETVDVASSTETLNDSSKDYILNGDATSTLTVTGKSVTVADATVSSDARVKIVAGDVEIKGTEFSGEFPKSTSNAVVSLNSAEYVTIKDTTFDSTSSAYNAIEIGLASTATTLPKSVLIENCKFEGDLSNNAILIFATQDNAVINLNNCTFENVSNPLRISNRTNAKNVTINVTNCTVNKWETAAPYQGFLLCQDYTSTTAEDAEANNLFGGNKITVNFINLVGPNGKVTTPSDISTVCGSADENQIVYVYRSKGGIVAYDANKFPVVNVL